MCQRRSFQSAAGIGKSGEKQLVAVLERAGLPCHTNDSATKDGLTGWDVGFTLGGREIWVEVKYDLYSARSGNLAVEYHNTRLGKPSGILATKSHLWCFVLPGGQVWLANTAALRRHFDTKPCLRDIACGGDDNAAMRLYRSDELLTQLFRRIDGLATDSVLTTVSELCTL